MWTTGKKRKWANANPDPNRAYKSAIKGAVEELRSRVNSGARFMLPVYNLGKLFRTLDSDLVRLEQVSSTFRSSPRIISLLVVYVVDEAKVRACRVRGVVNLALVRGQHYLTPKDGPLFGLGHLSTNSFITLDLRSRCLECSTPRCQNSRHRKSGWHLKTIPVYCPSTPTPPLLQPLLALLPHLYHDQRPADGMVPDMTRRFVRRFVDGVDDHESESWHRWLDYLADPMFAKERYFLLKQVQI